jgi:hypothetical protein
MIGVLEEDLGFADAWSLTTCLKDSDLRVYVATTDKGKRGSCPTLQAG